MYVQVMNKTKDRNYSSNNAYSTLPLSYVSKILGLYCISREGKKLKYSWPIWRITIITVAFFAFNSMSIYFSIKTSPSESTVRFQDYLPVIYFLGYLQYIVDLIFVYKYGRQRGINYYNVYETIDGIIGMPYYDEIKTSISKKCIFFVLMGSLYLISDCSALLTAYGWVITSIRSIDYVYTFIKTISVLNAIVHVNEIRYRFKRMNDILKDFYTNAKNLPEVTKDVIRKEAWINSARTSHFSFSSYISYNRPNAIMNLSKCYLLLLEQCEYVNAFFGFRILLGGLVYLLEMVILINLMIRLIIGTVISYYQNTWLPLISTAMKIINYSSTFLCGIHSCEQNYKETEMIVRCIDHMLTNKIITTEVQEALMELRELIVTRPVSFHAVNFYTLDYPSMLSMASAVLTYTIILLQNL